MNALQKNYPQAFLLLCLIARRARYHKDPCKTTGLRYRQAFIGDYKEAGIKTQSSYRRAKDRLKSGGFCDFVGYKSGANRGTVATLLPQGIFSIDSTGRAIARTNEQRTSDERTTGERRLTTKKQGNQETKKHCSKRGWFGDSSDRVKELIEEKSAEVIKVDEL